MNVIEKQNTPSPEHLAAIGEVINSWSMLNFILCHSVCSMIADDGDVFEADNTATIITTGLKASTAIGLLRTLVKRRFPKEYNKFSKLCDALSKANQQRDTFAHAIWMEGKSPKTIKPYLIKTVGGFKLAKGELTVEDIKEYTACFHSLQLSLYSFLYHWGLQPGPPDEAKK